MKKGFWQVVGMFVLLAVGAGVWFFLTIGEWNAPRITVDGDPTLIGRQKALTVTFADSGRGLRHISVAVVQDNQARTVVAQDQAAPGVGQKVLPVLIDTAALKLHDGPATLVLTAVDQALWKNKALVERQVTIDLMPPQIAQLNTTQHITPGGSGLATYRLSKAVVRTGVQVGDHFFPGYPLGQGPVPQGVQPAYAAYFALPLDLTKETKLALVASDQAGNETLSALPTLILKKKYRSDKVDLTERFLSQKMPEFQSTLPELRGKPLLDVFIQVNTAMRQENLLAIQKVCEEKTESQALWEGPFLRMKNAAPMALFGDHRTYLSGGKPVSESIHNGVDLASLVQSPIEAANHGIVRFTGALGIYGNAVIVDHGMGLMTLYGHLSAIQTQVGQTVKKGDTLGRSGATGFAMGDHLHFGMAIHGQFVDPKEWWDPHWIQDNVTNKLAVANGQVAPPPVPEVDPKKPQGKGPKHRRTGRG